MSDLGNAIKNARQERGWSQGELAERIDVAQGLVSRWETGKSDPSHYLEELQQVLGQNLNTEFAQWLSEERKKRKKSINELAMLAGVSSVTIGNIENGKTTPQKRTIDKLERVLGEAGPKREFLAADEDDEDDEDEGLLPGDILDFDPHSDSEIRKFLKDVKGIYLLRGRNREPVYVGKSNTSLATRVSQHKEKFWYKSPVITHGSYIVVNNKKLCNRMEKILIELLNPLVNKNDTKKGE